MKSKLFLSFFIIFAAVILIFSGVNADLNSCGNGICDNNEGAEGCDPTEAGGGCTGYIFCPQDCGEECATTGEEGDVYGKKCCSGLTSVPINVEPYDGNCLGEYPPYGTQFLCIKCGDGTCGLKENKCNCPQDCSVGRTWAICDAPICKNDPESRLCVNCGNNVCDQGENICTCPEDCNSQESPVRTTLNIIPEKEENKTRLVAELSNGRRADIKIMPETASQQAVEALGLKVCNEDNNCAIELKEVGKGENAKPVYEVRAEKEYKILWIFKIKSNVRIEIDAENGDVISIKKPWWSFLAW